MNEHFSQRLGRNYLDDDELTREEVATEVLTQNSGFPVRAQYVTDLVVHGVFHPKKLSPRKLLYQYSEVRHYVVRRNVGRHTQDNPSDNARRQREFKARRRAVNSGGGGDRGQSEGLQKVG